MEKSRHRPVEQRSPGRAVGAGETQEFLDGVVQAVGTGERFLQSRAGVVLGEPCLQGQL
ncbi:hypothetical protein [Streptomyces sp. NPDC052496]|uniref:hypothetical protein n=1 Tax=Streptomyces sp. NPDC052496 TaxID=3154951 RepID=UPI00343E3EAB